MLPSPASSISRSGVPPQSRAEETTLVSRTTRTGLAKLGAHRLQLGFEFRFGDLGASGLAQTHTELDQALGGRLADCLAHEALDRFGREQSRGLCLAGDLIG
jgi:hypothetical protein